jgi:tetratricopeptide (TPR) repeat protein
LKLRARGGPPGELAQTLLRRALADFTRAQELAPHDPVTYWFYGDLFALLKQKAPDVLGQYARALDQSPRFVDAYARALDLEDEILHRPVRRNFLDRARRLVAGLLKTDARNADAYAVLAQAHLKLKEFDRAFAAAQRALALSPNQGRALAVVGAVYLECKEPGLALGAFRAALRQMPQNYLAALGRARAYEQLADYRHALEATDYLLTRPTADSGLVAATKRQEREAHQGRARALRRLNRSAEARAAQDQADRIDVAQAQRLAAAPRK